MSRQRPYRQDRSPYREPEDPYFPSGLRSELSMLEEENSLLKLKCIKVSELQEKVQLVLRQNAMLLAQNQKMARILHQQKGQNEGLRSKSEGLHVQKSVLLNEFEVERSKLIQQSERIKDYLTELQLKKNNQINELKNAHQIELQSLKRQVNNSESSFDSEIRRYREQLDKKDQEVSDYMNKLKRVTTETDYQILKLREDKEKLKAELAYNQSDRVKQIDNLRHKLENNYLEELQALKRAHLNALEEAERENIKLRDAIQERNREIDQQNNKFNKHKQAMQDNMHYLKMDNQSLRNQNHEVQQLAEYQRVNLKERLMNIHQSELKQLIAKQASENQMLEAQIDRIKHLNHQKNMEVEQLIKEKVTNRNLFDAQLGRVKDDYAMVLQKYKDQEIKLAESSNQAAVRLNDREKHIEYLEGLLKDQKANSENETSVLQKAIQTLRQDLNSERMLFKQKEQAYKQQIADLKHQLEDHKLNAHQKQADLQRSINDLKDQLDGTSANLSNRADSLNAKNRALQKENEALKNSLAQREKQIKALAERLKASGDRESKLEAQIDDLRNKLIKREQRSNDSISQQKSRLEASYANALDSMKSDNEAAMKLEASKIRDLQEKLKKKQSELDQLLKMYKKMTEEFQTLTEQEANKKDITLKFPGATADLIATKNLFDVYLKTKVLDVCGDALKENPKRG